MTTQEKIRQIRRQQDLTLENVAHALGISASAYSKIERGKAQLSIERLEKIAVLFKMPKNNLLSD